MMALMQLMNSMPSGSMPNMDSLPSGSMPNMDVPSGSTPGGSFSAEHCSVGDRAVDCSHAGDRCTDTTTHMDCHDGSAECVCTTSGGSNEEFVAEGCSMSV